MMYKKTICFIILLCNISVHTMDEDTFGSSCVAMSNELTAQKQEKQHKKIEKAKEKTDENDIGYSKTEIRVISIGLLASLAFFIFDYMKR